MAILSNIGPDTYILLCKYCYTSVACHIVSSPSRFELWCSQSETPDRHVKHEKSGSSQQDVQVNEPFYHNGVINSKSY